MKKSSNLKKYHKYFVAAGVIIITAHLLFTYFTYDLLPQRIPVHAGSGNSIIFGPKSISIWYSLFITNLLLTGFLIFLSNLIFHIPYKYLSIYKKDQFLKLPPFARNEILKTLNLHSNIIALTGGLTLFAVHIAFYLIAVNSLKTFPNSILAFFSVIVFIEIFLMIIATSRKIDDHIA
ncbi:MAG: hypothetical protein JXR91_08290, partial [Deltaproteobacteria bacterium]|nr:hypothetical protein [Deltaproteobacteria bacterium]